ncbi:plasmid mobilization relaxosome protein MobC [Flavobacterium sp. Sd200]|uniref:plasmid mobilization protein n=1 Tax=Flavobacterium sp. Sd200 TaxID=2692211 RepID=UPI00136D4394|nr:plasmid mobilization relaxosome protein MobC [Flavobacterium sp. Sd200]MXN91136.1 plasmid mobilization relaxosome protein MobC [Flavobacterium sp. Sd200]
MEKENSKRTRRVIFRVTPQEYTQIERRYKASTCNKLSDFIRHCLLEKPLVTIYRNAAQDDQLIEMARLRQELNAIGNNFNQAVKRLHTLEGLPEFRTWLMTFEVEKHTLYNKIEGIKQHVQKVSESWLR